MAFHPLRHPGCRNRQFTREMLHTRTTLDPVILDPWCKTLAEKENFQESALRNVLEGPQRQGAQIEARGNGKKEQELPTEKDIQSW